VEALGLNIADWFILIVLVASGVIAFARGFTKEFLSLFLWLAAFIAAISLEYLATPKINEFIGNEEVSKIISYITVFVIFIFLGGIVIKFISKLIKWSGASGFDRFLGVLFGLIRGLIVLFVIFLLLPSSLKTTDLINNSKITPVIQKYAPEIEAYFRDLIDNRDVVEEALEIIEPLTQEVIPEPN
jgi:membrane protein required for colicin V production